MKELNWFSFIRTSPCKLQNYNKEFTIKELKVVSITLYK